MIVFSLTKDERKPDELHPFVRLAERAPGISVKQFVSIVADINEYLPDDWRMTMSDHEFRILVSYQGSIPFSLIGWSYRHGGGIIHIIDSVLSPSMPVSNVPRGKDKHPNLYYLMPRPDYSPSPLFARQFEKIKISEKAESRIQYHRIHPLTKGGIDPDHFHWLRWNAFTGEIQPAAYPEKGYHGKNYWALEELAHSGGRHEKIDPYLKQYNEIVEKHLHGMPQTPEQPSPYEPEFKLLRANMDDKQLQRLIASCRNGLDSLGFSILAETQPFLNNDTYFDDEKYSLAHSGMSFRLRENNDYVQVTLKARPPGNKQNNDKDCYRRLEEEAPISLDQKEMLMKGFRISALPYRLLGYLSPDCGALLPVMKIVTNRVSITMANEENQQAELRVDHVCFYDTGGQRLGADVEIEIESKGMLSGEIAAIAGLLKELDKEFTESSSSKYERSIQYATQTQRPHENK